MSRQRSTSNVSVTGYIILLTPIELVLRENQQMQFLWKKLVVSSFVTVLALFAVSFMGIAPVGAAEHGQLVGELSLIHI